MNGNIMATLLSKWSAVCESWKCSRIFQWLIYIDVLGNFIYLSIVYILHWKCTTLAIANNKRNWNALLWVKVLIPIVKLIYPFQLPKPRLNLPQIMDGFILCVCVCVFLLQNITTIFISIICDWFFFSLRFVFHMCCYHCVHAHASCLFDTS